MRRKPWWNVALFALTVVSVLFTGAQLSATEGAPPSLWAGVPFTVALIGILLTHEMAHYVFARRHRVDTSLPYFIPMPLVSPAGTLGAVIVMRSRIATRDALVDVGASGPIAGFIVAVAVLALGLHGSQVIKLDGATVAGPGWLGLPQTSGLNLLHQIWLAVRGQSEQAPALFTPILGDPLIVRGLRALVLGDLPAGHDVLLSPVAFAGWFGMLVTALNLMPIGQLDGGHVAYAALPHLHARVGRLVRWALVALGLFLYTGWLIWALITRWVGTRHPPVDDEAGPMSPGRKIAAWVSLAIFVLTFMPVPIQ